MFPRLLLLLSLLLPQLATAETYPRPVLGWTIGDGSAIGYHSTYQAAGAALCLLYGANSTPANYTPTYGSYDHQVGVTCSPAGGQSVYKMYGPCTGGQIFDSTTCEGPPCTPPQVRDAATGQCTAPPCETNSPTTFSGNAGWAVCGKNDLSCVVGGNAGQYVMPSSICDGQCTVTVSGVQSGSCSNPSGAAADTPKPITCIFTGIKTGGTCSQSTIPEAGTPPQVVKKAPPCDANQGVMTSSSGTVACVSEGTPSSNKPIVSRKSNTQTFPDGSTMTTETIVTRDPLTGAEVTSEKITRTPATGGGTGAAGTPGTSDGPTTSKAPTIGGGTSGNDPINNDLCAKNPGLQICKGGMNEEATQKKVLEELQKLTNPGETNYDAVKNAKETDASKEANDTENNKFKDAASGAFDPIASNRSAWQQAMEAPWFGAIPASGCQPFTGTIGNRSFVIDHCPTAQKISVIAEYAMWFGVVVGIFVMFTGGRAQGV